MDPNFTNVKELIDSGIASIPDAYIRPEEERPTDLASNKHIPIIDLSQERDTLVQQVGKACNDWGFFQVINHGIPETVVNKMFTAAHEFHALPNKEKMRYFSADNRSNMRFGTSFNVKNDTILNWRDFLRHDCSPLEEILEHLPHNPTSYREAVADYSRHLGVLCRLLLELISQSLGLAPDYICKTLGTSEVMASNYYPPCPQPELTFGLPPHTDPGTLTVLAQDNIGGLQICGSDGKWIFVKPISQAFVVNIADQLQILSNDRYKSAEHRAVVNSKRARVSIPYVIGPSWESIVQPVPELVEIDKCTMFKPVVYGDYMTTVQMGSLDQKKSLFQGIRTC